VLTATLRTLLMTYYKMHIMKILYYSHVGVEHSCFPRNTVIVSRVCTGKNITTIVYFHLNSISIAQEMSGEYTPTLRMACIFTSIFFVIFHLSVILISIYCREFDRFNKE
jgi:hypothetical protein